MHLVTEKPTKGGVYSISNLGNKLLAGINSKVSLYKFRNVDGVCELVNECGHHGHILALYTKCKGNLIVVGDLMRSICVLEYNEGALKEVARYEVARSEATSWEYDNCGRNEFP